MNNKGFTVGEMITAICIGLLFLIVSAVIYQKNIKSTPLAQPNKEVDSDVIDTNPTLEDDHMEDYSALEEQIKKGMEQYIKKTSIDETETLLTRTSSELINDMYLEELIDPIDSENKCRGYGLYQKQTGEYKGYLRCPGNYATEGYNPEFE